MTGGSKRVLVTGAAGFIGHACAREFLSRGWQVTALVHRSAARELEGAEIVRGSISDCAETASLLSARGPFDAVVNCAGLASDVARPPLLMDANYLGAKILAECLSEQAPGRLVQISTTDVYGIRDFVDADENTPLDDNLHQAYPRSKILAERAIAAALPASRYALLRPGAVCGPGDTTILPRVLGFVRRSPRLVYFGCWHGQNRWPLVHVQDVARAAFLAATCDEAQGQAYNVVNPGRTTVADYCRWVLATFVPEKAEMESITIPLGIARIYGCASTVLSRAAGRTRPVFEPSLYALHSVASNLDFSSRKLQGLFTRHGESFTGVGAFAR